MTVVIVVLHRRDDCESVFSSACEDNSQKYFTRCAIERDLRASTSGMHYVARASNALNVLSPRDRCARMKFDLRF